MSSRPPSSVRHLTLATLSFAVCFAAWGLISAFAPRFRELFSLSGTQTALLIAVPVLLGSLGRLPVGLLADRFGGRAVFTALMLLAALPVMAVIAIAIKLDSRGPVLFRQKRYGFNNKLIEVYKFRTMYAQASDELGTRLTERGDPRVTALARYCDDSASTSCRSSSTC